MTDSDSKRKVKKLLAKEAAMKRMEVDGVQPKKKKRSAIAAKPKAKPATGAVPTGDAMEM